MNYLFFWLAIYYELLNLLYWKLLIKLRVYSKYIFNIIPKDYKIFCAKHALINFALYCIPLLILHKYAAAYNETVNYDIWLAYSVSRYQYASCPSECRSLCENSGTCQSWDFFKPAYRCLQSDCSNVQGKSNPGGRIYSKGS